MPQPMPFTKTCFWSNWSRWLRDLGPPSVLDYPPHKKDSKFQICANQAYWECSDVYLSPEPVFGRIARNGFENGSSKCARRTAPEKWLHVSYFFEPTIAGMPRVVPFTRTCFWSNWLQWLRDLVLQECSTIRPPSQRHTDAEIAKK